VQALITFFFRRENPSYAYAAKYTRSPERAIETANPNLNPVDSHGSNRAGFATIGVQSRQGKPPRSPHDEIPHESKMQFPGRRRLLRPPSRPERWFDNRHGPDAGGPRMSTPGQFLLYTAPDGAVQVDVFVRDETVWLTQKALAELFGVNVPAVNKHLKNIFESGKLSREATISKME
jgi:hypothetical protein